MLINRNSEIEFDPKVTIARVFVAILAIVSSLGIVFGLYLVHANPFLKAAAWGGAFTWSVSALLLLNVHIRTFVVAKVLAYTTMGCGTGLLFYSKDVEEESQRFNYPAFVAIHLICAGITLLILFSCSEQIIAHILCRAEAKRANLHLRPIGFLLIRTVLLVGVVLGFANCGEWSPTGMLLWPAAIGGLIAFGIVSCVAFLSQRPMSNIDAIRIGSWSLIGCGLGSAFSPFPYAFPRYASLATGFRNISCLIGFLCLIATLCISQKPRFDAHPDCCRKCGYKLTGLTSLHCPECGEAINVPTPL